MSAAAERINRHLARRGVASRRTADVLIAAGRVLVNGAVAAVGTVVHPGDEVRVDGRRLPEAGPASTIVLNKPRGVVTTRRDPEGRPTVMQLAPDIPGLVPVGRLDADTRGLLVLTTDGELAHRLAHPRYGLHRTYVVTVATPPLPEQLGRMRSGVVLEDGAARPIEVRDSGPKHFVVVMAEGRKREVRRMCAAVGIEVSDLRRVGFGPLHLGDLPEGACRDLTPAEEGKLRSAAGLA